MKPSIQKLVSYGHYKEALLLYAQSHASSIQPTVFTFPFLLKSCANLKSIPQTQQLHTHILKTGFQSHIHTSTALASTYLKLHRSVDALQAFDEMPNPTLPSFNAVISGLSQSGYPHESIDTFKRLYFNDLQPNSVTITSVLPACGTNAHGSQLHGLAVKAGHELDQYVATALVTMYSNCAEMGSAWKAFGAIRNKTVVSYNAMICGFLRNGSSLMALDLFREMVTCSGEKPSLSSLLALLSVCSDLSALLLGKEIHCYVMKYGVISDVVVGTTLVDMYSKCGSLDWAHRFFMRMDNRNVVTFNSMISGLLSHGRVDSAVELFHWLRLEGFEPDSATWNSMISGLSQQGKKADAFKFFVSMRSAGLAQPGLKSITSLLHACSSISDIRHGKEIHCHLMRTGAGYDDKFIQTALVTLYMKCGYSLQARQIFNRVEKKSGNPALWNAVISGYGRTGETDAALEIFRLMQEQRVNPNSATFLSAISACSHAGLVEKGCELFGMMNQRYGINPTIEHFSSMVDLLSRAGKLDAAWDLIQKIPRPSASAYSSLLAACGCHSDAELGKVAAERLSEMEPRSTAPMVILSNIYAREGKWNDTERLRKAMIDRGLKKVAGCSWSGLEISV